MARKPPRQRDEKKLFYAIELKNPGAVDGNPGRADVAHFIRQWRKHRGLTQQELAKRIKYTDGAISHIETGQSAYTQTFLEAIAKALDCKPGDLILHEPKAASGKDKINQMISSLNEEDTTILLVMVEAFVQARKQKT